MISYAGIDLTLPTAELAAWVAANLDQGVRLIDLWGVRQRDVPLGSLYWPAGAARWAEGWFLATGSQLDAVRAVVYASGELTPAELVMGEGQAPVAADLWMLPPIPLTGYPGDTRLWLLPLVDRRYRWRLAGQRVRKAVLVNPVPAPGQPDPPDQWEQALRDWFTEAGEGEVIIDPRPRELQIGVPTSVEFRIEALPDLLDAVAAGGGSRVVVPLKDQWGGKVRVQQPWADDVTPVAGYYAGEPQVDRRFRALTELQAGGQHPLTSDSTTDVLAALPGSIRLVAPKEVGGVLTPDGREVVVPLASIDLQGGQSLSAWDGPVGSSRLTVRSLITANDDAEVADLVGVARAWAWAWYAWRVRRHDFTVPGVYRWEPEGYSDIEWHVSEGRSYTRVTSADLREEALPIEQAPPSGGDTVYNYYFTTVNYYESVVNYYNSVINVNQTTINLTDVTITVLSPTYIYGDFPVYIYAPVYIGYGTVYCGWTWYCSQTHGVAGGPIDLDGPDGLTPPHTVARLVPAGHEVIATGFEVVPPPAGVGPGPGQYLITTNVGGGTIVYQGTANPGEAVLPWKQRFNDGTLWWFDPASEAWRPLAGTYGDFRFGDSSEQTVTTWNSGREADFVPRGDEGDFLRSRLDPATGRQAPVWRPRGLTREVLTYRTDCVEGRNQRWVQTETFTDGLLAVVSNWKFDSDQGCCKCPGTCCTYDTLCFTLEGSPAGCVQFDGTYVLTETTPCVFVGENENGVEATLDTTTNPDATLQITDGETIVFYSIGTFPIPECAYTLNWTSTSESSPCVGDTWPDSIDIQSGPDCPSIDPPPPPPCCEDDPTSIDLGGVVYQLHKQNVGCTYLYQDPGVTVTVDTQGGNLVSVAYADGSVCEYQRPADGGCLGEYAAVSGCPGGFPAAVTVS